MKAPRIAYLKSQLADLLAEADRFGWDDRIVTKKYDALIANKEMAESLLCLPVNIQKDGNVTVGIM